MYCKIFNITRNINAFLQFSENNKRGTKSAMCDSRWNFVCDAK